VKKKTHREELEDERDSLQDEIAELERDLEEVESKIDELDKEEEEDVGQHLGVTYPDADGSIVCSEWFANNCPRCRLERDD
jgi:uncharacterized protein YydD (DUF2326 family)